MIIVKIKKYFESFGKDNLKLSDEMGFTKV